MKILVVEDEHRIAQYIKKGLELKSHVVDVAFDGEAGFDLAISETYDLIILDRMLPKLDGIKFCQEYRKQGNHTPILMLTARTAVDDRVTGLDNGCDDYLGKPFAFTELIARVNALARRPKQDLPEILTVGSLSLNPRTYQVLRAGQSVTLSKKEYALLEFLMRHPGQVFSPEQLTEQVWSYESDVLPNTAQVYIGYLRTKIDTTFPKEPPVLKTVRGFGYKLEG
jgi:two-component system OmpR family response regulator